MPSVSAPTTNVEGVSLAEFVFALGLAVVVVLTLVGLSLVSLKGNQKSNDVLLAQNVAHQLLERELYLAQENAAAPLWSGTSAINPVSTQKLVVGHQDYTMALYAQPVSHSSTQGLVECTLRLNWSASPKAGYGHTFTEIRRVVSRP